MMMGLYVAHVKDLWMKMRGVGGGVETAMRVDYAVRGLLGGNER